MIHACSVNLRLWGPSTTTPPDSDKSHSGTRLSLSQMHIRHPRPASLNIFCLLFAYGNPGSPYAEKIPIEMDRQTKHGVNSGHRETGTIVATSNF